MPAVFVVMTMGSDGISPPLLARVLERLGLPDRLAVSREGLNQLYAAWCAQVPFDNTRKLVALRTGHDGPLPEIDPADFLRTWLTHGTGGTCWPSCNALFAVVTACGFEAERTTASMLDMGTPNHGTIVARVDGADYLVDSSMLLNRIVHLTPGETVIDPDPLKPVELETVDGQLRVWFESFVSPDGALLPCRLLTRGVDEQTFRHAYEASRTMGPFNCQLVATRNRPGVVEVFRGRHQLTRHADGRRSARDHDARSLVQALTLIVGLSPGFVETWVASGALAASLESRHDPPRQPIDALPPSRRQ